MALTYRSVKGSALTITELDDNFRHFTSSHAITASAGPVIISGSDGSNPALEVTGSVALKDNLTVNGTLTGVDVDLTGSFSGSLDSTGLVSGSFSGSIDGAQIFVGNLPTVDPAVVGQLYNDGGTLKVSAG